MKCRGSSNAGALKLAPADVHRSTCVPKPAARAAGPQLRIGSTIDAYGSSVSLSGSEVFGIPRTVQRG
jgi:hypothetical protein